MTTGTAIRAMVMGMALFVVTAGVGVDTAQAKRPAKENADLGKGRKIVIVHTNDLHGNLEPDSKKRGGLTRIAALLQQIRKENPNKYALGILIDHFNDSKSSIHDREVIYPGILGSKGWRTYRLCGLNWINDPRREISQIKRAMEAQ